MTGINLTAMNIGPAALSGHLLLELVVGCVQGLGVRFPNVWHQSQGTEYQTCNVIALSGHLLLDSFAGCVQGFGVRFPNV